MKNIKLLFLLLFVVLFSSACNSTANESVSNEEDSNQAVVVVTATEPTTADQPLDQEPEDIDVSMLGETQLVADGGFSFRPVAEYDLNVSGGMVMMTAPGADLDIGPVFQLMGWKNDSETTNQQLYDQFVKETPMEVGPATELLVDGIQGLSADISGDNNGKKMQGRIVLVMVDAYQQFVLLFGAPQSEWETVAPYFDGVLSSIDFTELETFSTVSSPMTSNLAAGKYVFTNGNVVNDLIVYQEVVYAATQGGLVTWRLDSGYSMQYTPLDGMGQGNAYSITYCEIPEPRILVGTLTGISIYDPNTGLWEQNDLIPEDSTVNTSKIDRLYCDQANNRLLIGYTGLGVLDMGSGTLQQFTDKTGLLWNSVFDITVNGTDIWIANGYKGISQISGAKITNYNLENGILDERANALAFAKDGTLWVGASKGLMSLKNNKWTLYGSDSTAGIADINELEIDGAGNLWAATASMGGGNLCQFNVATAECDVKLEDTDFQGMVALAISDNNQVIIGTARGVSVLQNGTLIPWKTEDQLISNVIDSFALAPDGTLWVGTNAGIQILDPANPNDRWMTYKQKEDPSMGGNWASGIAFAPDGTAWVSFINGNASRFQNGVWTIFEDIYSYDCVAVDLQGRAWFGDDSKGIVVLNADGSQAMRLTSAEGLPGDNVQAILVDLSGRVWIGTNQGLAKYENEKLEIVFGQDSTQLPNKYIRALALQEDGALIIGTFTGVARYNGTDVLTLVDFLKDGYTMARLTSLAVSPTGRILVGTDSGLLYSDDSATWEMMTTRDGLPSNYISALAVDQYGATWIGGGAGILQIVP